MQRKKLYLEWIKESVDKILRFQDLREGSRTYGSFFYPNWKGNKNYVNARWQEAVFTLAWKDSKKYKKEICAGINYWCKIQRKNGSFTELCKFEQSFSATAFTSLAIAETCMIVGLNDFWKKHLIKAGLWLCKNDETILINQEAVAALALLKIYQLTKIKRFLFNAEKKLNIVLNSQKKGYYPEQKGFDFGYSTLTLSMLARYYEVTKDKRILESVKRFLNSNIRTRNIRKTNWAIIDGFEIFSKHFSLNKLIETLFEKYDVWHLPNNRHVCTDSCRLCFAYNHAKTKTKPIKVTIKRKYPEAKPFVGYLLLRPFGVHKIRRIIYKLK